MNASPISSDGTQPPFTWVARLRSLLVLPLSLYVAGATVFGDPFPFPVLRIAGTVMIGLVLVNHVRQWVLWYRSNGPRSSLVRRLAWTLATALLAYGLFTLTWFNPLPGTLGMALLFALLPVMLGVSAWSVSDCQDEVYRASIFEGYTWGTLAGLCLVTVGIFVMRISPPVGDWLQAKALTVTNGLTPAAVGFGFGAAFALVVVALSMSVGWAMWWFRRR